MTLSALSAVFFSLHTAVDNCAMNKITICCQWRSKHFKPRMLLLSVGNSAMNGPRYWQRRDDACAVYTVQAERGDQCDYSPFSYPYRAMKINAR
jgi:hypothetical protein